MELQMMCYVNERNIIMFKRKVLQVVVSRWAMALAMSGVILDGNAQGAHAAFVNGMVSSGGNQTDLEPNGGGGGCAECNEN